MSDPSGESFVKRRSDAPAGFFSWEAAGLDWLHAAQASGGVRVVGVQSVGDQHITLDRVVTAPATPAAAEAFAGALAATHAAGAGRSAAGRRAGPARLHRTANAAATGVLAMGRVLRADPAAALRPGRQPGRHAQHGGTYGGRTVCARLEAGEFDDDRPPARIHGDLWAGNVLYERRGAVLIDPAAHGGHGLTDLAMLALFGTEHLDRVQAAYAGGGAAGRLARADRSAPTAPGAGACRQPWTLIRPASTASSPGNSPDGGAERAALAVRARMGAVGLH